jgi:hypothetical protein
MTPLDSAMPRCRPAGTDAARACAGTTGSPRPSCSCCSKRRPREIGCARASSRWRTAPSSASSTGRSAWRLSPGGGALCRAVGPGAERHAGGAGARARGQSRDRGRDAPRPGRARSGWRRCLRTRPDEVEEAPRSCRAPAALPEALLKALDARLATAAGLARRAATGRRGLCGRRARAPPGVPRRGAGGGAFPWRGSWARR